MCTGCVGKSHLALPREISVDICVPFAPILLGQAEGSGGVFGGMAVDPPGSHTLGKFNPNTPRRDTFVVRMRANVTFAPLETHFLSSGCVGT